MTLGEVKKARKELKPTYREAAESFMVRVKGCVWEELDKGGTILTLGEFFEAMRVAMKDDKFKSQVEKLFVNFIKKHYQPKGYTEQMPSPDCINID